MRRTTVDEALTEIKGYDEVIAPQPGPQLQFLACTADIAGYGGHAGGGKTYALLLDPLHYVDNPRFHAVIFRRRSVDVTNAGGMWDESHRIYAALGAKPRTNPVHEWTFPSGAKISFRHCHTDEDVYQYKGAQIAELCIDQAEEFTEFQFWYLMSRNRTTCGIKPIARLTMNPDPDSYCKKLFGPWVDDENPLYKVPDGRVLWLVHDSANEGAEYKWFTYREDAVEYARQHFRVSASQAANIPKGVTYFSASVFDNRILLERNPEYLANLYALPEVERARLLHGDWKARAGRFYPEWKPEIHVIPTGPCVFGPYYYISLDYGFAAPFACYLWRVDADERVTVCREIYQTGLKASDQARAIIEMLENEFERPEQYPDTVFAGFDVFAAQRGAERQGEPIADIYMRVWSEAKWYPALLRGGTHPETRASKLREYLSLWPDGKPGLLVMECCKNLIRTMPTLVADPNHPEKVDTRVEDHAFDALTYGLVSRPGKPDVTQLPDEDTPNLRVVAARRPLDYYDPYEQVD